MKGGKQDLGDFQTPETLAGAVCELLKQRGVRPDVLVEPACGEGRLVTEAIKAFPTLQDAYCVELQASHEQAFWQNVSPLASSVKVRFIIGDAFKHEFPVDDFSGKEVLILGNPPWVTNTQQSRLGSTNVPRKSNVKRVPGIEAMTGKGNFDIAEALIARVANQFAGMNAVIGMICKSSVARNLVRDARLLDLRLSGMELHAFDAGKVFGVAASGAFFIARIGKVAEKTCAVYDLFDQNSARPPFGWYKGRFVSDIRAYKEVASIDGRCPCPWRQGLKHDAVKVMLLKRSTNGTFTNGFGEKVSLETDLIFPMVKGSALRDPVVCTSDTFTIVTQANLSDDTAGLQVTAPRAWQYLVNHAGILDGRKSAIYKKRPRFSLFGIGEYAFKPFKIGIASFYKDPRFSLVFPVGGKPAMLDDTCYYLAFENLQEALCTLVALDSPPARAFLEAITFRDGKRIYTKEILSRLNLSLLLQHPGFEARANSRLKAITARLPIQVHLVDVVEARDRLLRVWTR
ncbi:MAG: hypothetical protein Q6373_017105 [Candidatus Sigynarchaeota archaeon]